MALQFEDLEIWKRSSRLTADIYKELQSLQDWGFRDQITRSALSIPSNIAEGFERLTPKDCVRFLGYAKGSCGELRTQVFIGMEIKYIDNKIGLIWIQETKELSAMIAGLIKTKNQHR